MPITTCVPLAYASSPTMFGSAIDAPFLAFNWSAVGDPDPGVCLQAPNDGKEVDQDFSLNLGASGPQWYFEDTGAIPALDPINSVTITLFHSVAVGADISTFELRFASNCSDNAVPLTPSSPPDGPPNVNCVSAVMTLNPVTGVPWVRADLFNDGDAGGCGNGGWFFQIISVSAPNLYTLDYCALTVDHGAATTSDLSNDQAPIELAYSAAMLAPILSGETVLTVPGVINDTTIHVGRRIPPGSVVTIGPCSSVVTASSATEATIDPPLCASLPVGTPTRWRTPDKWGTLTRNVGQCSCCGDPITTQATADVGTGAPMSTVGIPIPWNGGVAQFLDDEGLPLQNGFVFTYAAGSLTPLATYSDAALTVENTNPVELDGDGKAVIFMGPAVYKFDVQDANNVSMSGFPRDNIAGSVFPGRLAGAVTLSPAANADAYGHQLQATINKASTGTHALFAELLLQTPTINPGGATLAEATTLYIVGPPAVGTKKFALHVAAGLAVFDGSINLKPMLFSQLPAQPAAGGLALVTDSNTNTWGAAIAGGAANVVLAFWNGSAWTVAGK